MFFYLFAERKTAVLVDSLFYCLLVGCSTAFATGLQF